MSKAAIEDIYPLSPMQQGMLFHALMAPENGEIDLYVRQISYELQTELNIEAFRCAWQSVLDRHPALRTAFVARGKSEPRQVVFKQIKLPFEELDWCDLSGEEQTRRLDQLHAEDRQRAFRLVRPPLLRLTLVHLDAGRYRCLLTYHHLILDGWSITRVLQEATALYEGEVSGRPARLPAPRRYGEFIAWLTERQQRDQDRQKEEAFWREQLTGTPGAPALGIDRSAHSQSGPFVELSRTIPSSISDRLDKSLRGHGLTWSTLAYGVWALLLSRYGRTNDVIFGAVFSGRPAELPGADEIVGLMVNTLPLRVRVPTNGSLASWLEAVQKQRVKLHEFEHSQLAEVQRWSSLPGGAPLFESLIIFENFPKVTDGAQAADGLPATDNTNRTDADRTDADRTDADRTDADRTDADSDIDGAGVHTLEATNYPLTLLVEVSDGIRLHLAYDAARFEPEAIDRLFDHLRRLYEQAADLDQNLNHLNLLSEAEKRALWLEGDSSDTRERTPIHQLVAERAQREPDVIAIEFEDGQLSRHELDRRARHLAALLQDRGVEPESLVAIRAEASAERVIALLAVLRSGGAYLPLDPNFPDERLAYMLEDSGANWILSETADERPESDVLPLASTIVASLARQPSAEENLAPARLAYVIYTSGSTGRPKGVAIPHGALTNFLFAMALRPGLREDDALLAVTTLSFDIAGLEIYLPLLTGARLLLASRETARDGHRLATEIVKRRATALQATPSTWRLLVEAGLKPRGRFLALSGGEALSSPLAGQVLNLCEGGQLFNLYGPTETTIWSAVEEVSTTPEGPWARLGRPILCTQIRCVDERLRQVPTAVPGELVIGGDGLARGYLGRAPLTSERFVPDARGTSGARIYRTGDLVRQTDDGQLDYLGRLDHQIKLRGHRIELGEIEDALSRYPGIETGVVVGLEERPGDLRLVAYYVPKADELPTDELRGNLRQSLPEIMVPGIFIALDALPQTPNGKIDRKALPRPDRDRQSRTAREPKSELEKTIAAIWAEVLEVEWVGVEENFFDLGGHSLLLMRVRQGLSETLDREIELLDLFRHTTVSALARHLAAEPEDDAPAEAVEIGKERASRRGRREASSSETTNSVAIIGMAGRFPGAPDLDTFWANLRDGREGIVFFSDEELLAEGIPAEVLADPNYVKAKGLLEEADGFDAEYFGYPPREAEIIDPQQRVFLETAVGAFENAGYDPARGEATVGVYAGTSMNTYWPRLVLRSSSSGYQAMIGNDKDFLATRVSYKLDLKGPSVGVQTACSTSLVAVHMAAQSLLAGECDLALAGGVSISWPRRNGYLYSEGMIVSPDGHCRPFDAKAQGTVSGEGAGAVILKRLEDALADGDSIRAVLRGTAINNDGAVKVSYTAPSIDGQAAVIAEALAVSGVEPESVAYVEAHGTGTPLGDPIELKALEQALGPPSNGTSRAIGSVKSNIGHLDAAAGIAGLIKTVLALEHGELPPSLHYQTPNPGIDFDHNGFRVNATLSPWQRNSQPRRAGVSSFGIGGTNAHVIVEEAPLPAKREANDSAGPNVELFCLSARSEAALETYSDALANRFEQRPELDLADVAFTLERGRRALAHRRVLIANDLEEAAEALANRTPGRVLTGLWTGPPRATAWLFPGQGAQRLGMGQAFYHQVPVFRQALDRCADLLKPALGEDLRRYLVPKPGDDPDELTARLQQTRLAQPALFSVEYALAQWLLANGVEPEAMLGHSIGEYVAACLAGVFELKTALKLVATRGRLMDTLPAGAMRAVSASPEQLESLLAKHPEVSIAAINAPSRCVVSGPKEAVEALVPELQNLRLANKPIRTSHAFHSAMMEPILEPFRRAVEEANPQAPQQPFLSNLTGTWITDSEATRADYWVEHLRRPVRFADGIRTLLGSDRLLVEVGPGQSLTGLVHQQGEGRPRSALALLPKGGVEEGWAEPLGRLWLAGVDITRQRTRQPRRVALPSAPFVRQRLAPDPPPSVAPASLAPSVDLPSSQPLAKAIQVSPKSEPTTSEPTTSEPRSSVRERLFAVVEEVAGFDRDQLDLDATFLEIGVDSLLLGQFSEALAKDLGVEVPIARLMDDLDHLRVLITHVETALGVVEEVAQTRLTPSEQTVSQQTVSEQTVSEQAVSEQAVSEQTTPVRSEKRLASSFAHVPELPPNPFQRETFGPFQQIDPGERKALGERRDRALADLFARFTQKTRESKRRADAERLVFADNRSTADFRQQWKEIVYPIIGERSQGARIWDVDGNEYVDLAMGFGVHLFGHSPDFITNALRQQIDRGLQLGPQSDLAGEVAAILSRLTGMERIAFSNTGTEAVMTAVRLARAATGRSKIVLFAGSYHGASDGVLMRGPRLGASGQALPVAPGVPAALAQDVVVLPYGEPSSLATIQRLGEDLAAVLVEPVQSRRPDLQPGEFLRELRRLTHNTGTALIFDEVITGLRTHPGGAQAIFEVEADLATYGKVLGGGMPIGVVAGCAHFMDAIDGGAWQFGDESFPRAAKTFFAGTFCKHPLSMAAARAVLRHLDAEGPALQEALNQRTAELVERLNTAFEAEFDDLDRVPMRAVHFGSLWRIDLDPQLELGLLFYAYLLLNGVYTWEGRTCFLSTAHSEADVEYLFEAIRQSVRDMRQAGFFPPAPASKTETPTAVQKPLEIPTTHAQQQLWFLAQMDENASRGYNESQTLSLSGRLDADALDSAFAFALDRHDALRATFSSDGRSLVIRHRAQALLPRIDLTALAFKDRKAVARKLIHAEARRLFDLEAGPLVRALLLQLDQRRHRFVISCHHAVLDGQSLGLLLRELEAIYCAAIQGTAPELGSALALGDLVQREVTVQDDPAALAYWLETLRPSPPVLELPVDRPRPPVMTYRGDFRALRFPVDSRLRKVAVGLGTTQFGVVFAAYCLLLHRLTGQSSVLVGVPSAAVEGRGPVLGYALLLLPIRSNAHPDTPFAELVANLRQRLLEGQEHRNYSYTELIKELGLNPRSSRSPLVANVFNLDRARRDATFGDLAMEVETNPTGGARFELFLNVTDFGDEMLVEAEFNADLFDGATLERWMRHYHRLLEAVAQDPAQSLIALPLLSAEESEQIVHGWNETRTPVDTSSRMNELFRRQAERTPDAVAVISDGKPMTYRELASRSGKVARHLRALGCGRGDLVAIDAPRSFAMIVAALAVLEADAAYVPLSANFPTARKQWILDNLGSRVLLTGASKLDEARELLAASTALEHVVCLDVMPRLKTDGVSTWADLEALPETPPRATGDADDLAYIIFTSGSTGTPKGVMVRHRPAVNLIDWVNRTFDVGAQDQLFFVTSLTFDLSVYDIFGILAAGGTIRVASEAELEEPESLVRILREEPITFWDSAPAALQQLAPIFRHSVQDSGLESAIPSLSLVFLSGDWIPVALPGAVTDAFPKAKVIGLGGATEATIWSNVHPIENVPSWWTSIPYGKPIQNARYHVLNARLAPCPIGVAGDLYIGGDCLASGYALEPALTASKFLPDPFVEGRIYRTGDRARYRADGELEFLGRLDHQVKIRGFRIELGEIESTLAQHPDVGEVAVIAREDTPGSKRLVAYVTARHGSLPSEGDLLAFIGLSVPDYMVPSQVVPLDDLPVTANGKLDRAALPSPEASQDQAIDYEAPRTAIETRLADIWAELLGRERVGLNDRFLEIGGDSVLSLQVVARAAREGIKISHRQIYEFQTLGALAEVAERMTDRVIEQQPQEGTSELTPIQRWFFDLDLKDAHHFNQAVIFKARQPLDSNLLRRSILHLVREHGALRQRFTQGEEGWQAEIVADAGPDPVSTVDLSRLAELSPEAKIARVAEQVQQSLDLKRGPLLRAAQLYLGEPQGERLLIAVHHLAIDGVSWQILLDDLQRAYQSLEAGEQLSTSMSSTPLRQWSRVLADHRASDAVQAERTFWREQLGDLEPWPEELDLGPDSVASTKVEEVVLDAKATRTLLSEVPAAYRTEVGDVLVAALARALGEWSGRQVVHVDLEGHGREEWLAEGVDLSRTLGWFTVLYPARLALPEADHPGADLRTVKEQLRAIPGRGLGHGLLMQDEQTQRPSLLFNYLGKFDRAGDDAAPLVPTDENTGTTRGPRQQRTHPFEINSFVAGGELRIRWSYSAHSYRAETIEALATAFLTRLRELIAHAAAPSVGGFTASDFPLAQLDDPILLEKQIAQAWDQPIGLAARNVEDMYPLSTLQYSLFVNGFADKRSSAGFEQLVLTLGGELDTERFHQTWQRVIDRHPVLRTAFFADGLARPLQVVARRAKISIQVEDWREIADPEAKLEAFLAADRARGFDLGRPPLSRLALLHVSVPESAWHLVWSHHHLILDGWCRALVMDEVMRTYTALAQGTEPDLQAARPYRDYIAWLEQRDDEADREFWRAELESVEPTPLVVDRQSDLERGRPGERGRAKKSLTPAQGSALRDFAQRNGTTPGTVIQAAWALFLSRYTGREDVLFGATVAGRPAEIDGIESMVGMFINNLPVRTKVPTSAELGSWLRDRQGQQQELRQREHTALETLQELSGLAWGRRLFETLVVFQNFPVQRSDESSGTSVEPGLDLHSYSLETTYPVTLVAEPSVDAKGDEQLDLDLYFETARLDQLTAERWLGHFIHLLDEMAAASPNQTLGALSLLNEAERRQLESAGESVLDRAGQPAPVGVIGRLGDGRGWARRRIDGSLEELGPVTTQDPPDVLPREIAAQLERHPQVREAWVATPDGETRPVAWIESSSENLDSKALHHLLRGIFAERTLPTDFVILAELPRLPDGEIDLDRLPRPETKTVAAPPRTQLERDLVELWEELFDLRPIGIRDNFFELGGHSLLAVRLMSAIRTRFGRDLPLEALFDGQTVEHLAARLTSAGSAEAWSPLVEIQPGDPDHTPLFLVHPSGGGAIGYIDLARHLDRKRPVYGLQARGHVPGQTPLERVEAMAELYLSTIRERWPSGPYLIGGLSFGGYVAYEMAQQLRANGEDSEVILLDTGTWAGAEPDQKGYLAVLVGEMMGDAVGDLPQDVDLDGQLSFVFKRLHEHKLVDPGFTMADLRHYFALYWTNIQAAYAYRPQPYAGRVVLFRALDNPEDFVAPEHRDDPTLGWEELVETVEVHDVPGSHFNLLTPPHVGPLAEALDACLARLDGGGVEATDPRRRTTSVATP